MRPFYFSFDVGVMLAIPKGTLHYICTTIAAICRILSTDVLAQQAKRNSTIGSVAVLPLQLDVGYRF